MQESQNAVYLECVSYCLHLLAINALSVCDEWQKAKLLCHYNDLLSVCTYMRSMQARVCLAWNTIFCLPLSLLPRCLRFLARPQAASKPSQNVDCTSTCLLPRAAK